MNSSHFIEVFPRMTVEQEVDNSNAEQVIIFFAKMKLSINNIYFHFYKLLFRIFNQY